MKTIKFELFDTLEKIDKNLGAAASDEEYAILLNARANVLIALQKYEDPNTELTRPLTDEKNLTEEMIKRVKKNLEKNEKKGRLEEKCNPLTAKKG